MYIYMYYIYNNIFKLHRNSYIKKLEDKVQQKKSDLVQLSQQYIDVCTSHDIKAEVL